MFAFASSQAASFGSGITYTGRIVKDENPVENGTVRFFVWIQTQGGCDLYAEQRDIDMTGSGGTYSFEIGNGAMTSSFPHTSFGIKTIADVFDNTKKTSDLDTSRTGCLTFTPNSDEGRVMKVQFIPPGEVVAQALPDLVLTAVPTAQIAFNATKVNGYGSGDLLKVDPAYTAKTTANNPLTAAQYEEFWKLILGTSTTYLKAIPTLGGDVTGTLPAMTVVKIQNVAVTAPTTGDTGKVLTYNGTGMVWSAAASGGITTLNGLSGTTQSFVSGTTPLTISSSGSAHTFNITDAGASSSGLLTQTDWNTFNSKQSSALGAGQVWIGNASGAAQAQTLSGDVTISSNGVTSLKAVGTAGTYTKVVTDAEGRVTSGSALASGDVTAALGYTPASSTSGYVNGGNTFAGNATIGLNDAYNLGVKTNGATRLTVTGGGNVGIGTTSPSNKLHVDGGTSVPENRVALFESTVTGAYNGNAIVLNQKQSGSAKNAVIFQGNGADRWAVTNDVTGDNSQTFTIYDLVAADSRLTINSLGYMGTGTSWNDTVTNQLTVKGNTSIGSGYIGNAAPANGLIVQGKVGIATASPAVTLDVGSATDAVRLPNGTDAQRPANAKGNIRYNTTSDVVEYNNGSAWVSVGSSLGYTAVNRAGDTMTGDLTTQNLNVAAGKFLGLGAGSTAGTVAGQVWYDSGVIKYFDGTSAKTLGVSGSGITSLNGLTNGVQSFVVGSAGNTPSITSSGSAHTLDIPMASASGSVTAGLISNADYAAIMAKQSNSLSAGQVWVGNASNAAQAFSLSGDVASVSNTGSVTVNKTTTGTSNTILALDGSGVANAYGVGVKGATSGTVAVQAAGTTANYSITLPATSPTANQIMQSNGSGVLSWVSNVPAVSNATSLSDGKMWLGNSSGVAVEVAMSGDATISNAGLLTLKNTGTVGTYTKVITDAQGRVTSGSALASGDVTTALGYTPASVNSGYVNGGNTFAGNATIGLNDAYTLSVKTNNVTRMTFAGNGNIGILTASPQAALHIADTNATGSSYSPLTVGTNAGAHVGVDFDSVQAYNGGSNSILYLNYWGGDVGLGDASKVKFDRTNSKLAFYSGGSIDVASTGTIATANGSISSAYGNIYTTSGKIGAGGVPSYSIDAGSNTDAIRLPSGLDATRPANAAGLLRYNTTSNVVEFNNGSGWSGLATSSGATGAYVNGGNAFTGNATIGLNDAYTLGFKTNNATQMTLDSAGKLGIGTATPISKLHVHSAANADNAVSVSVTGSGNAEKAKVDLVTLSDANALGSTSNNRGWSMTAYGNGYGTSDSNDLDFSYWGGATWTQGLRIAQNGNVGIGTNDPQYSLDFNSRTDAIRLPAGTTAQQPSNAAGLIRYNTTNSNVEYNNGSGWSALSSGAGSGYVNGGNSFAGNATIGLNDAYNLSIKTNNLTRMTFLSNGNTGIGTTTPTSMLTVENTGDSDGSYESLKVINKSTGASAAVGVSVANNLGVIGNISTTSSNYAYPWYQSRLLVYSDPTVGKGVSIFAAGGTSDIRFYTGGDNSSNERVRIDSAGKVGIGTTSPAVGLDVGTLTDAIRMPVGNTSQRPSNASGLIRYNSTLGGVEYNTGSGWQSVATSTGSMSNALTAGQMWVGNASNVAQAFALSGDVSSVSNTGSVTVNKTTTGSNNTILALDGSGVANVYGVGVKGATSGTVTLQSAASTSTYSLKLPSTTPVANQVMQSDASGNLSWATALTSSTGYMNGGNAFAGNATIGLNDAYTLGIKTNNATRMTIDSSGNVGVGTATPQLKLDISGNAVVRGAATSNCNEGMNITRAATSDYTWTTWHTGTSASSAPSCSDFDWMLGMNATQSDFYLVSSTMSGGALGRADAAFQVAKSGNMYFGAKVGVGTTSPAVSLDLGSKTDAVRLPAGNSSQRPSNATGLIRYNTSLNTLEYNDGSGWNSVGSSTNNIIKDGNSFGAHLIIGTNDNYDFRFETNGATAMTIEPSGEVGIGTTTPGYKLDIVSTDGSVVRGNTYSSTASQGSNVTLYRARGTASSPTAAQANDTLGGVYSRGYGASTFGSASTSYMEFSAAQNFTEANRGSYMTFFTTPNNSTTPAERMRIAQNGNVGIGTNNPGFTLEVASSAVDPNYANMQVTNTAATNTWTPIIAATAPNAVDGAAIQVVYGVGPTNGNRVEEAFVYHGDANAANAYSLGFYGNNDLLTILYGGNIGLGTADPVAGVQIGENAPSANPRQLFMGEAKTSGTARAQIVGQWNSNGTWGIGPSTTAVNDFRVKIGYANGTNADWDSSQRISLDVDGPVVSNPQAVTGATVNLAASNTITISAIGSSTITLQNMVHGGNYTLLVSDTTSRTYTFSGCNTSKFKPANTATVSGTSTMYNIITVYNGSTYDCWITWASGYQ